MALTEEVTVDSAPPLATLLDACAPLARSLAEALCHTRNGRDDCGALHGVWVDLRLLNLAADPNRHAAFYAETLGAYAAGGAHSRVLISGCADWGMLATVADAYRRRAARLDATAVDRCATPLLLCAWYGAMVGLPVRTAMADVSLFDEPESYDVVCTHSLLTYRPLEGRRQLVGNWQRLLRRGGVVVTVTRLATPAASAAAAAAESPEERALRFGDLAVRRLGEAGLDRDAADLRARAERFAVAQVSFPVGTEDDVRALFEREGFEVTRLDVREIEGAVASREPVAGAARRGAYAEIVAVKR